MSRQHHAQSDRPDGDQSDRSDGDTLQNRTPLVKVLNFPTSEEQAAGVQQNTADSKRRRAVLVANGPEERAEQEAAERLVAQRVAAGLEPFSGPKP